MSKIPKVKVTITLDPEVAEVLTRLQTALESRNRKALASSDIAALHGSATYNRSMTVQTAILALCARLGVSVSWKQRERHKALTGGGAASA